jgi:hypothetical protein
MSDAHTHWIAPFWEEFATPQTLAVEGPRIYVMNPSLKAAEVLSTLFDTNGSVLHASTDTVQPRETALVNGGIDSETWGWCGITSDVAVLPWGVTQFASGDTRGWANMTFFRVDRFVIEIDPEMLKQLQKRPRHR